MTGPAEGGGPGVPCPGPRPCGAAQSASGRYTRLPASANSLDF